MIATIELNEIEIYAHHGCYEEERRVGNKFIVSARLDVDITKSANTDDINDALNYVKIIEIICDEMASESHLLENVTKRIVSVIWNRFSNQGLLGGSVKVAKIAPPVELQMKSVSLEIKFNKENLPF